MGQLRTSYQIEKVTIDSAAAAYSIGDQVGTLQNFAGSRFETELSGSNLKSVTVMDESGTKPELDLLFFQEAPTVTSVDNGAVSVSDAEMDKCLGVVTILASDYMDLASNAVASAATDLVFTTKDGATAIYVLAVTQSAVTLTASGLKLKLGLDMA